MVVIGRVRHSWPVVCTIQTCQVDLLHNVAQKDHFCLIVYILKSPTDVV